MTEVATIHPWEKAGLGKAPFRFLGVTENVFVIPGVMIKAGGTCDYCSNGIRWEYWCADVTGKKFKVGCDCIAKVHAKGTRIVAEAERAARKVAKEAKAAKVTDRVAAAKAKLEADPAWGTDRPHPMIEGKTLRDYVTWMFAHAGDAGRVRACKMIEGGKT